MVLKEIEMINVKLQPEPTMLEDRNMEHNSKVNEAIRDNLQRLISDEDVELDVNWSKINDCLSVKCDGSSISGSSSVP